MGPASCLLLAVLPLLLIQGFRTSVLSHAANTYPRPQTEPSAPADRSDELMVVHYMQADTWWVSEAAAELQGSRGPDSRVPPEGPSDSATENADLLRSLQLSLWIVQK